MEFFKEYLKNIKDLSASDTEHSHRTHLENFLNALKNEFNPKITIAHEPPRAETGEGAPDFMFIKEGLNFGYLENKRIGANLDEIAKSAQIAKYFRLSENIILCDYVRFCLLRKNNNVISIIKDVRISESSALKNAYKSNLDSKFDELKALFSLFFLHEPKPINTALEFANSLALRTQILKDELLINKDNAHILNFYTTFKTQLYDALTYEDFCDSFAQTLTYSLFLAKLNLDESQKIDLYNAKKFIPKSFPLIRAMSDFLDKLENLQSIKWLIDEILYIINHINIASIVLELNRKDDIVLHKDPYLHFYETFLSQYDARLREVRGVYYTPASVVKFIVNAIDDVLKRDFKFKGLSSALDSNITLLDFATGTGTFLLEAFRKTLESIPKNSPNYNPKKLLDKFFGFEYLIAPYTIAHLKLSQSFKEEFSAPLDDNQRLGIYLTNTLYFKDIKQEQNEKSDLFSGIPELIEEAKSAQSTKEKSILIITGNPPYSGASSNKGFFEDEVRITYGLEPSLQELDSREQDTIKKFLKYKENPKAFRAILDKHKLQNEKNPKWLLDDYVKFIRFGESKIQDEGGIFAFISNNGFIDNPTFRGMRFHLLKTFDRIYILDLHGNARKKESCPDGSKDENVFDIMQGVSINIFVKLPNESVALGLGDKKGDKNTNEQTTSESILLVSESVEATKSYNINGDIVSSKGVLGVGKRVVRKGEGNASQVEPLPLSQDKINTLARIYHYDLYGKRNEKYDFLLEKAIDSIPWSELHPKEPFYLFIPQNNELKEEYDKGWSVKEMFNLSSVGIATAKDKVLIAINEKEMKNQILEFYGEFDETFMQTIHYRPFDFRKIYYDTSKVERPRAEVMQHFLQDNIQNLGLICDRNCKNKLDNIFVSNTLIDLHLVGSGSNIFPLYLFNKDKKVENFTPKFREFIDSKYGEHFAPEVILGYIYAILFHKKYREKYLDFLKIDFPKIPFVDSKEEFLQLSALGSELIKLHLLRDNKSDSNIGEALYKDIENKNNKIEKISYIASEKRLFVNSSLHFNNVAQNVWEYKIGGYQVLDKYLKSHKGEEIDWEHFQKIIQTLHKSLKIEGEIAKMAF